MFIRACDTDLIITEELLDIISLKNTTTGEDIFNEVYGLLEKYNLLSSKLVCVATDGAPSVMGKQNGLVAKLMAKQKEVCPSCKFQHIHWIIHQEVLCSKIIKMNVLQFVKKVVNFIQSGGLNQRQFSLLYLSILDIGCEFESLPYYAEVRWHSCYSVLKRFWLLREEGESPDKLCDDNWVQDLAFMVDITWHLNDLNLKLQGKRQLVVSLYDSIKAFKLKLKLWEGRMKNGNLIHFPTCQDFKKSHRNSDFTSYVSQIMDLVNNFENRFKDFKSCENISLCLRLHSHSIFRRQIVTLKWN
ncbi:hypothetical protein B7P43_G10575 [Cryptotermes secundus]|uniref:DUF4371 domain-containing protein n=1 Tax=Cryptotermes secundus TaxID=105785 RepID=A0A2J7QMJ4_9NEOP|nr:hypothetical protein B7P43_G10575 [Cryptotermes secundus]